MRLAVAIAICLVAGVAFADTEINVKPNRIELGAAALDADADAAREKRSSHATRAQDYNSSRSNTTSARDGNDLVLRKRPGRTKAASPDAPSSGRPTTRAVSAQDYNSSRSNNGSIQLDDSNEDSDSDMMMERCEQARGNDVDDDCDDARGAATPANHNTTRSNRTTN